MFENKSIKTPRFVTPEGSLIVHPSKFGLLMGNRGTLGPKHHALPQPHAPSKPWITCLLKKDGIPLPKTEVSYTRLFFLDEVTAFASGHRPCSQCQYHRHVLFSDMWIKTFGKKSPHFDEVLHRDRCNEDGTKRTYSSRLAELPSGVIVRFNESDQPYLLLWGKLFPWSMKGYDRPATIPVNTTVNVLTPISIVEMLKAGFSLLTPRIVSFRFQPSARPTL